MGRSLDQYRRQRRVEHTLEPVANDTRTSRGGDNTVAAREHHAQTLTKNVPVARPLRDPLPLDEHDNTGMTAIRVRALGAEIAP